MSLFIKFYFTSSMLNMFRALIYPSSGACDFSIVSPHWSCVLVSMCFGVSVWLGRGGIRVAGWSLLHGYHPNHAYPLSTQKRNTVTSLKLQNSGNKFRITKVIHVPLRAQELSSGKWQSLIRYRFADVSELLLCIPSGLHQWASLSTTTITFYRATRRHIPEQSP